MFYYVSISLLRISVCTRNVIVANIYTYIYSSCIQCQLRNSIHIDKDFFPSWSWKFCDEKTNISKKEEIKDRTTCIFLILFTRFYHTTNYPSLPWKIRRSNYRTMHIFHSSLPAIHAKHSCAMAADLTSNFLKNIPNIWTVTSKQIM